MDAEKSRKLQQYAVALNEQAVGEEKSGKTQEAAKHYLKLVDVFLVLAAEAQDHGTWQKYIHQAEAYQNKTRSMIPKDQQVVPTPVRQELPTSTPQKIELLQTRLSPLKKIMRPFQKEVSVPEQPAEEPVQVEQRAPMDSIPAEIYQRVVAENKLLREKVASVTREMEERVLALQGENGELQKTVSEMVPRADYELLQSEFTNMVPKNEYERVRAQFLNMVPKEHYDELLNRISQMVPKQDYLDAERRVLQLEDAARNSVPKKIIDDLANEISMLGMLSEVPIEEPKEDSEAVI